jgi:hypothetical protein
MESPSKEVLARMPLAEAVLWLWRWVMCEDRLQGLWARYRGRCYERSISFGLMVQLVADALLQYRGSGRRSFEKRIETHDLAASYQAAYGKLGRLPIALSQALLAEGTAALRELWPPETGRPLPPHLRGFAVVILDGKAIKRVAKRLRPLRGLPGGLLGGRALVALEYRSGLAVALHAHPDGDANDVRFVADLVPRVRQCISGPRLWLGDSAFCDLEQPPRFTAAAGDHYLLRYHPKVKFHPDLTRSPQHGIAADGHPYSDAWGWLGSARDKRRRYVRRITLELADKEVTLVTDLLDAAHYPAEELLALYAQRWGIEQMFQKVTEVFGLQSLIGGTPQACIFQLAFCLLLHNLIQVVRAYVAAGQQRAVAEVSSEKLFDDVQRELIAWTVVMEAQTTLEYFAPRLEGAALQARLHTLLGSTWRAGWLKAPKQKRHRPPPRKRTRTHNSVYRILQAHRLHKPTPAARLL